MISLEEIQESVVYIEKTLLPTHEIHQHYTYTKPNNYHLFLLIRATLHDLSHILGEDELLRAISQKKKRDIRKIAIYLTHVTKIIY